MRILIALTVLFLLVSGCTNPPRSNASFDYKIFPCSGEASRAGGSEGGDGDPGGNPFRIERNADGSMTIIQNQSYVCCANITVRMEDDGRTIRIYEDNIGQMCRCICPFSARMMLNNISGYGNVEVYGIRYQDVQGYQLLFNTTIEGGAE